MGLKYHGIWGYQGGFHLVGEFSFSVLHSAGVDMHVSKSKDVIV